MTQFPVVGVGASAGGLSAFTKLLKSLPLDTGMAFVLVSHLDPKHTSLLPELLSRVTALPVMEITGELPVKPNHVYIMPPKFTVVIRKGVLHLIARIGDGAKHMPIDEFFQSLALDQKDNAIGVILSGTASDGSLGVKAIKLAGGTTIVQSEDSAEFNGMPHNAIATNQIDFILPPEDIAIKLTQISDYPRQKNKPLNSPLSLTEESEQDSIMAQIFLLLKSRIGIDFTNYKQSTIRRRLKRRMTLHQIYRVEDYVKFLNSKPTELDALFQDMLINVTSFFRDSETFDVLAERVLPSLMMDRPDDQPLRIWVPACSTGEEAYSISMLIFEIMADSGSTAEFQIFASDIDQEAIHTARRGIYPKKIADQIDPDRLKRFFIKVDNGYQICRLIRDTCIFTIQNVIKDPPFSKLDLVCCRNLMIYLDTSLQKKILQTFHCALRPEGYLVLGTSESISTETDLFYSLDKKYKVYHRSTPDLPVKNEFPLRLQPIKFATISTHPEKTPMPNSSKIQQYAEKLILEKYSPPGVVINHDMQILQFIGQTDNFIQPSSGSASLNLLKMVRPDLMQELRQAVRQSIRESQSVRVDQIRLREGDRTHKVNLQVLPLSTEESTIQNYLVLFESVMEEPPDENPLAISPDEMDAKSIHIRELEKELLIEREHMRSFVEDHEAANEELQSANEEVQSANEELQSINEELETAKEELQSTNEELETINDEQENRNAELNRINDDFSNLLASIELVIVILHTDLRIRRFTPAAKSLMNLIDGDVGRPISNIRPNFEFPDLEKRVREVIDTLIPQTIELQDHAGHWYSLRLRPYLTRDDRVDGAVMAFIGIDSIKDAARLREILQQEQRLALVVRNSSDAVILQDFTGSIQAWNHRATELYGYSEVEALSLNAEDLIAPDDRANMKLIFERLKSGQEIPPCESHRKAQDGHIFKVWVTVSALIDETRGAFAIVMTEKSIP
jgi:two-component system CheB/CheR fusion protein